MGAPFGLLTCPIRSRGHIRFGLSIWHVHRKRMKMVASYRYVSGPVRQRNHLPKVASRSLALSESVSLNRPDSRAGATQIVDSWIREGDVRLVPWCSSTSDTRLKGATYEAISDDSCVKLYTPAGNEIFK